MIKSALTLTFFALLSTQVSAEFINVDKVICDVEEISDTKITRVFLDLNKAIFGIGETSDQNCRTVDF